MAVTPSMAAQPHHQTSKQFGGAPFGTQTARFDVSGIHPQSKLPGTFTQAPYDRKSMSAECRRLGPGRYGVYTGCFDENNVNIKSSGPGWGRAYEVSKMAQIPHLLYRDQWQKDRILKRCLGPGRYSLPDFAQIMELKPGSSRGICQTKEPRFTGAEESDVPGPGTYGEGGVPSALMEKKQSQSTSRVGLMDAGASGSRQLPIVGSDLAPGVYHKMDFTQELSEKVTSLRGPYDLFTGERSNPIAYGHLSLPKKMKDLGPGEYELKSFVDEMGEGHCKLKGSFKKGEQYASYPTERIYYSTPSQMKRKPDDPGPGQYDPSEQTTPTSRKLLPFQSSAERFDQHAKRFFLGSSGSNPVGSGRYNILKFHQAQHVNGHKSLFLSKSERTLNRDREKLLEERMKPKDVPQSQRVFLITPPDAENFLRTRKAIYTR